MAEIKSYSLWLQHMPGSTRGRNPGGIPVTHFSLSDSRVSSAAGGGGGGFGKAKFDTLELTVNAAGMVSSQLSQAHSSGANLGHGKLAALLNSGCSRVLLEFENAMVSSLSGNLYSAGTEFSFQLSMENPRMHWQAIAQ